ncbi:hypothetical protein [Enterobacter hormaechei]|uniref:hypothetical protein n=1 Tax=Enterobacter hormaechei TaxID=158836 RepID=UPI0034D215CC
MEIAETDPTYAMLYNKTITSKEYLPGVVIPASELDFRYSAVHSNATPTYYENTIVSGNWILLGYLPINTNAVCIYRLIE